MRQAKGQSGFDRRDFLRTLGVAGASVAAGGMLLNRDALAADELAADVAILEQMLGPGAG